MRWAGAHFSLAFALACFAGLAMAEIVQAGLSKLT